jgi:hypothetical protein
VITVGVRGAVYEIPVPDLAFAGRGLDPALFEVGALLGRELGGRLPVVVRYQGRVPALPGITITRAGRGAAWGYLTPASALAFGAALARQDRADRARASYGMDGLFGGGVSVSLAGSPAGAARAGLRPAAARGTARQVTLTVHGVNLAGTADSGDFAWVFNVDHGVASASGLVGMVKPFTNGLATFSVPAGHYLVLGSFFQALPSRQARLTVLPQVTVAGSTTVTTTARAANSRITMITPRRASPTVTQFDLHRVPAKGATFSFQTGGQPLWVSAASKPVTVGQLQTVTSQLLTSAAGTRVPYVYDLSYEDLTSQTIPPQRFVIHASSLATLRRGYFSAARLWADVQMNSAYPIQFQDIIGAIDLDFTHIPASQTVYLTAGPRLVWFSFLTRAVQVTNPFPGLGFFTIQSNYASYRPGDVTDNWNAYPLHPAPNAVQGGPVDFTRPFERAASATRAGNVLTMYVVPFSDNTPGHLGAGLSTSEIGPEPGVIDAGTFEVDQNGVKIASGDATGAPAWQATLGSAPATIRFTLDASRTSKVYPLSPHSHTVWTWRSAPQAAATLPAGWFCGTAALTNKPATNCASQPLLSLDYQVSGLGLTGTAPAGAQRIAVTVAHFQPSASVAAITSAALSVSFDGGKTWHPATLTGSNGHYTAGFTTPAGALVTLRTSAAAAAGSTSAETITSAYRTGS